MGRRALSDDERISRRAIAQKKYASSEKGKEALRKSQKKYNDKVKIQEKN